MKNRKWLTLTLSSVFLCFALTSGLMALNTSHATVIFKCHPIPSTKAPFEQRIISIYYYPLGLFFNNQGKCVFFQRPEAASEKVVDTIVPIALNGRTTYIAVSYDSKIGKVLLVHQDSKWKWKDLKGAYAQCDPDREEKPDIGCVGESGAGPSWGFYESQNGPLKIVAQFSEYKTLEELQEIINGKIKGSATDDGGTIPRKDYFTEAIDHYKAEQEINRGLEKLAHEKLQLLARVKSDRQVSEKEITKLQALFRRMGSAIQAKQAEKNAAAEKFAKITREFNIRSLVGGGRLTPDQKAAIEAEKKTAALLNSAFEAANYRANEGLLTLVKTLDIAWDDLEKGLRALKEKQENILKIQKEMLTLMSNKVLQRIGDKRLHHLEGQLKQLMGEESRLLGAIMKDFALANKVYPPDARLKREMTAFLQERQRLQKTIVENNGKIEEFFKETDDDHRDRAMDETPDGNRAHLPSVVTRDAVTESGNGDAGGSVTGTSADQGQDPSPSASGIDSAY